VPLTEVVPTDPGALAPPTGRRTLPYSRQQIDDDDVAAVIAALRSDWLTTGPRVAEFEAAFAQATGAREAVALSSGTAALHATMAALDIGPGDEVIVPPLTFAASANCVVYQGGTPVFADVDPGTLLLDPAAVARKLGPRTRAVVAVDYAGQPCDYQALEDVVAGAGVSIVADACHALGASYRGRPAGTLAMLNAFSLHPVKPITTAEGGVVTTDDSVLAARMRQFRNHGIATDHRERERQGAWTYDMTELGFNYRLSDLQCALGTSQLHKLPGWLERRRVLAARYDALLPAVSGLTLVHRRPDVEHAYHLYVVQCEPERLTGGRDALIAGLRAEGIGATIHYPPVHLHGFYRARFGTAEGLCPVAEAAAGRVVTLPLFPAMDEADVDHVVERLRMVLDRLAA